jgi:hypothetical protein
MPAPFKVLDQDAQDDIIVSFMEAQERDAFCHDLNQTRYTAMLTTIPGGPFRDRIQGLLDSTIVRSDEVARIIEETDKQMPPQARVAASKLRTKKP